MTKQTVETIIPETREVFYQNVYRNFLGITKVTNIVCTDGKRRTFTATALPDTFFSVPGRVKVNGVTVTGFLTSDSVEMPDGGEAPRYRFVANSYGKNGHLLPNSWDEAPDFRV